jgi:hypothetical protein
MRVTVRNTFHNTSTDVVLGITGHVGKDRVKSIRRNLCGVSGCHCGGSLSERGDDQSYAITSPDGAKMEFVEDGQGGGRFQFAE